MSAENSSPLNIVVLISGGGTNLQAIIDASRQDLPVNIAAVISNVPGVYGLERARQAGIETRVMDHKAYASREDFDQALMKLIDEYQPELVVLAGFMRILTPQFVAHYAGRMLNIHPSLLPELQGLHTHRRALEQAHQEHGASIHFVTEELDGGPVIVQARVPVLPSDDERSLAARVLEKEHIIYPLAIRWFAEGRVKLENTGVVFDGQPLRRPLQLEQMHND